MDPARGRNRGGFRLGPRGGPPPTRGPARGPRPARGQGLPRQDAQFRFSPVEPTTMPGRKHPLYAPGLGGRKRPVQRGAGMGVQISQTRIRRAAWRARGGSARTCTGRAQSTAGRRAGRGPCATGPAAPRTARGGRAARMRSRRWPVAASAGRPTVRPCRSPDSAQLQFFLDIPLDTQRQGRRFRRGSAPCLTGHERISPTRR